MATSQLHEDFSREEEVKAGTDRGFGLVFAGFFLYIGAAELLPEAHRNDRSRWVVLGTLGGVIAIYAFSVFAGAVGAH